MKRKIISTSIAILGLIIIGYSTLTLLGFFNEQEAGLMIDSDPVARVYINNVEVAKTPYEASFKPGEVNIKIKPESENDIVLDDYETKVNLVSGVKTIIKRSFKESEDESSGIVVSFERVNGQESYITTVSVPDNAQILVDGAIYGYSPLRIKIPAGDHNLTIRSEGYEEQTLPVKVYKGYKLTAVVKLAKLIEVPQVENIVVEPEVKSLGRIKIKKNDVGFLRVRSGTSTGFPEIGQVKPDEVYEILEEGENGSWYKIQLPDVENEVSGRQGWVKAEFVTLIK